MNYSPHVKRSGIPSIPSIAIRAVLVLTCLTLPTLADDFWKRESDGKISHDFKAAGPPVVLCMQGRKVVMQDGALLKLFGREQERRARWQNLIVEVQNRDVLTTQMILAASQSSSTADYPEVINAVLGALPIIGAGGIMSGADAVEKLHAGATLVQLYSGLIYRGPALVRECVESCASALADGAPG